MAELKVTVSESTMPVREGTDRQTRRGCNGQNGQDKNCVRCVADRVDWSGQTETE
jgi:hypothetical protein